MRTGDARVFLGDVPASGVGHEGLRGSIRLDDLGIHFDNAEIEWLQDGSTEWEAMDESQLVTIPLHRIHSIEWGGSE